MNVGDLIRDPETGDIGILVEIDFAPGRHNFAGEPEPYRILNADGKTLWFGASYIENNCEVISASR
tara:strand:- start:284 stop:481 length:198 start_codon:yes stop_codon:yes gene_type:complete